MKRMKISGDTVNGDPFICKRCGNLATCEDPSNVRVHCIYYLAEPGKKHKTTKDYTTQAFSHWLKD